MSKMLLVGSLPLTMWKRCWMLLVVLMLQLAHAIVTSWTRTFWILCAIVLTPIRLSILRVKGHRVQSLARKLLALLGVTLLVTVVCLGRCLIMHHTTATICLVLFGHLCVTTTLFMRSLYRAKGWWLRISMIRSCPLEVWRQRRIGLKIVGPGDSRDDTAATVTLKHAYDHIVTYDIVHPSLLFRLAWETVEFGCLLLEWFCDYPVMYRIGDFIDNRLIGSLTYGCSLDVSASLARQVKLARNAPLSMTSVDMRLLIERAAANEGSSNISSFQPHDTQGEIRLNTARYVMATQVLYREQLELAGF